jgi:hypothetical protein
MLTRSKNNVGTWRRIAHRSAAIMAILAIGLVTTTATAGSQAAGPTFAAGQGNASSQAIKVNPTIASLSLGITLGISLAGYQNEVAKAESRGLDLGIIGTILAAEGCQNPGETEPGAPTWPAEDQPQPLAVDSREDGAAQGKTGPERAQGIDLPLFTKTVRATADPLAEASTLTAPLGQPGAVSVAGGRSDAVTRTVDHKTREAIATAEIGSLDLGGGVVRLGNLKWSAVHHSGADNSKSGTFTIGSVSIAGVPLPIPSQDPSVVFAAINPVLATMGIELRAPVVHEVNGAVVVDPLTVAVVPSATRDQVAGTLFNAIQPVRQALTDAILALDCGNDTYVTVLDVAIGSVTGAGSFSLELGGAQAFTGEINQTSLLKNLGGPSQIPAIPDEIIPGTPGVAGSVSSGAPAARVKGASASDDDEVAAPIAASTDGSRGGKLAALAAGTLLLLAAVAELDRRKMRAAMQTVQTSPTTEA